MIGLNKIIKVFAVHPMANTKLIVNNSYLVKKNLTNINLFHYL